MADDSDLATEREEIARNAALLAVRERALAKPALLPIGYCHNCDATISEQLLFCDCDCRDDWQKRISRNKSPHP